MGCQRQLERRLTRQSHYAALGQQMLHIVVIGKRRFAIGGFAAEYLGWRWTNWLVIIFSGVGWVMCSLIKETYAPELLQRKAAKIREETGDDRWWSRYDQKLSSKSFTESTKAASYLTQL